MSILAWIALGVVGGTVAGWLSGLRGRPLLGDTVAGVLGAVLAGFVASISLGLDVADLDTTSLVAAALGALVLILVVHFLPPTEIYD